MLNLLKLKKIKNQVQQQEKLKAKKQLQQPKEIFNTQLKHFPSSVREWKNSIYYFNKNALNLIPYSSFHAMEIIQNFFNLYNKNLEKKIRIKRLLLRLRRLSSNRIYLSSGEFKHKNNSVLINIYLFNRQKNSYLLKLKKNFLIDNNKNYIEILKSIYLKGLYNLRRINNNKYLLLKTLDVVNKDYKISTLKSLSNYTIHFYKKILNLTMKKLRLYFLYKQLVYVNKSKFNYTYLRLLKKHLEYLYNKNVEFNLVNLKRFYLNSDILSDTIKLKIARNKVNKHTMFKDLRDKINTGEKNILRKEMYMNLGKEINNTNLKYIVLNNLKHKHITGFKLQVAGRLSRRATASRSGSMLEYKGNLLNIDSSYRGISSIILKGNLKSSMQYTGLNSKTRLGSFGIKGWISAN